MNRICDFDDAKQCKQDPSKYSCLDCTYYKRLFGGKEIKPKISITTILLYAAILAFNVFFLWVVLQLPKWYR